MTRGRIGIGTRGTLTRILRSDGAGTTAITTVAIITTVPVIMTVSTTATVEIVTIATREMETRPDRTGNSRPRVGTGAPEGGMQCKPPGEVHPPE